MKREGKDKILERDSWEGGTIRARRKVRGTLCQRSERRGEEDGGRRGKKDRVEGQLVGKVGCYSSRYCIWWPRPP